MTKALYPPDFIKLPPDIACADVDDALIVTMARILGLCWGNRYRRTLPYTPDELSAALGRSRATLYRHLDRLQGLDWLQVDRRDRRLVLQPLVDVDVRQETSGVAQGRHARPLSIPQNEANQDLSQALQDAGIIGGALHQLLQRDVNPAVVRAWTLWAQAPEQHWLDNPAGYIVNRLRDGSPPPQEFIDLASLTADEIELIHKAWVRSEQFMGWPSLPEDLAPLADQWIELQTSAQRTG